MADITMCSGEKDGQVCPLRESCYRHTATVCQYRQSWFVEAPFIPGTEGQDCGHYWPMEGTAKRR